MIKEHKKVIRENLWNRLARDLVYDSKQLLLYGGIKMPEGREDEYSDIVTRIAKGAKYGIMHDPITGRLHFEPDYIQNILDKTNRFDFPVYDRSFGPGGIAGFIHRGQGEDYELINPDMNHILKQAMLAKNNNMPFGFVSARQLRQFEVEQFGVWTRIFDGPIFFFVSSEAGINEAAAGLERGHYLITNHSILASPLTLAHKEAVENFFRCVEREIPVMLTTQPLSGQTGPMTPYGTALLAFAEFLAGMAMTHAVNPQTKVVNGAYPTMCTPGKSPSLKLGTVVHNLVNYLVAYTSRLLDVPSIQSGCSIEGAVHGQTILETDYQTVRGMLLWETIFEGWHMIRHVYGFLDDLTSFSFQKAEDDIVALWHLQGLDDNGITAVLANNVRLNSDIKRADRIYQKPSLVFDREGGGLLEVILETMEIFLGDFGRHEHTLKNIPNEWF